MGFLRQILPTWQPYSFSFAPPLTYIGLNGTISIIVHSQLIHLYGTDFTNTYCNVLVYLHLSITSIFFVENSVSWLLLVLLEALCSAIGGPTTAIHFSLTSLVTVCKSPPFSLEARQTRTQDGVTACVVVDMYVYVTVMLATLLVSPHWF